MRRVLFLILVITFFVGCASSGNLQKIKDIVYFENDGLEEEISFYNTKVNNDVNITDTTEQKIILKSANNMINMHKVSKGHYLAVVDIDNGMDIDIDSEHYWVLKVQKLKYFKIYKLTDTMVEIVVFKSKDAPVCESYLNKEYVFASSLINYYALDIKRPVSFFSADMILHVDRDVDIKNIIYKVLIGNVSKDDIAQLQNIAKANSQKYLKSLDWLCYSSIKLPDINLRHIKVK